MTTPPSEKLEPTTARERKDRDQICREMLARATVGTSNFWECVLIVRLIADIERYRAALSEMLLQHDEFIVWPPPEQSIAECRDVLEQGA